MKQVRTDRRYWFFLKIWPDEVHAEVLFFSLWLFVESSPLKQTFSQSVTQWRQEETTLISSAPPRCGMSHSVPSSALLTQQTNAVWRQRPRPLFKTREQPSPVRGFKIISSAEEPSGTDKASDSFSYSCRRPAQEAMLSQHPPPHHRLKPSKNVLLFADDTLLFIHSQHIQLTVREEERNQERHSPIPQTLDSFHNPDLNHGNYRMWISWIYCQNSWWLIY